jgi:hypothetical protein
VSERMSKFQWKFIFIESYRRFKAKERCINESV